MCVCVSERVSVCVHVCMWQCVCQCVRSECSSCIVSLVRVPCPCTVLDTDNVTELQHEGAFAAAGEPVLAVVSYAHAVDSLCSDYRDNS